MASTSLIPRYPIYVISKGRWDSRKTSRQLEMMHVPYQIVVEPQEHCEYARVIDPAKILVLPFSNLGQGSIPARNWVWEHAITSGHARHWILDDNIHHFCRLNKGRRVRFADGSPFCYIEDFVDRYFNVALAGMNYRTFGWVRTQPFSLNTRIYSCILILNSLSYRWRGRYNEDTDLSLRVLKDGWTTALFNAFLCDKAQTMSMPGGNTDELYRQDQTFDGRLEMARSLQRLHPDVVKITRKWGRWQHHVDYRPFKDNRLIKRERGHETTHKGTTSETTQARYDGSAE